MLPVLAGADYQVSELGGGLTNTNLLVQLASAPSGLTPGAYVARCSNGGEEVLGIDRAAENVNSRAAAAAGVGAPVVAHSLEAGILLVGFVEGQTLTNEGLAEADGAVLDRMATAIRTLHRGPGFAGEFNMFARQAIYRATVNESTIAIPHNYDTYAPQWSDVRAVLEPRRTTLVPCNNDLLAGNFIDAGDHVWLIDYEYSGMNAASFELGNTITECELTDEQARRLVTSYWGEDRPHDYAEAQLQALCSEYGWSLWGFIQSATSPLDFDFYDWGLSRFHKAQARFESPQFTQLLEVLS